MQQKPPWVLIATLIAGGALTGLANYLSGVLPKYAPLIAGFFGFLVIAAGLVVTYYQAVNAPATKLAPNVLTGNIAVTTPDGTPTGASVVTTDTTLPISAPQKGAT
jgi:hypothetical protein